MKNQKLIPGKLYQMTIKNHSMANKNYENVIGMFITEDKYVIVTLIKNEIVYFYKGAWNCKKIT